MSTVPSFSRSNEIFPRKITHENKLQNCERDLEFFLGNISLLREKLGTVLIQLPPDFTYSMESLENFIEMLPENIKFAVEFRHTSWYRPEVYSLLQKFRITFAWPVLDYIKPPEIKTTDNLYIRFLGNKSLKKNQLGEIRLNRHEEIDTWVKKILNNVNGMDTVFIYANNHYEGLSPDTLKYIRNKLKLPDTGAMLADRQKKLF